LWHLVVGLVVVAKMLPQLDRSTVAIGIQVRIEKNRTEGMVKMPYQVRAGSVTAVVANEKQALDMLRRLAESRTGASVRDVFGSEVDVAILESRANGPSEL
jgi:hypothetical protein